MLTKVYEDEDTVAYKITTKSYTRADVAKALGISVVDPFNIVDEVTIKYYSERMKPHRKVIGLYTKFGGPLVVLWKRPYPYGQQGELSMVV